MRTEQTYRWDACHFRLFKVFCWRVREVYGCKNLFRKCLVSLVSPGKVTLSQWRGCLKLTPIMLEIHQDVPFACRIIPVEESFVRNSPHLSQQQIAALNGMIMNMRRNFVFKQLPLTYGSFMFSNFTPSWWEHPVAIYWSFQLKSIFQWHTKTRENLSPLDRIWKLWAFLQRNMKPPLHIAGYSILCGMLVVYW